MKEFFYIEKRIGEDLKRKIIIRHIQRKKFISIAVQTWRKAVRRLAASTSPEYKQAFCHTER